MKSAVLGFAMGLVAAVVASMLWPRISRTTRGETGAPEGILSGVPVGTEGGAAGTSGGDAESRAAELAAANQELLVDLMRARSNLAARVRTEAPPEPVVPPIPESAGRGEASARLQEIMQAAVRQQLDGRIARMKRHINLDSDQEASIRALLERQMGGSMKLASRFFGAGEAGRDDAADPPRAAGVGNMEEQIRGLLTPEQLAGYETMQEEERVTNARLVANAEMLQLQQTLGLSVEQQDKVYGVLYQETHGMLTGAATRQGDGATTPRAMMERKLAALEQSGVLEADQLARYRRMQEEQMELIESMVRSAGGDGGAAVPDVQILTAP